MDLRAILKSLKVGIMLRPQLKDDGDFANNTYFDTQGLSALLVLFIVGDLDAAVGSTAEDAAPKIEECDTSGGTYADITGAALSAVIGATDDNKLYGIFLDLAKTHKRYVRVNAPHAGDGTNGANMAIIALGFPADTLPSNAAGMGLAELVSA